jgi:hypothetical protein
VKREEQKRRNRCFAPFFSCAFICCSFLSFLLLLFCLLPLLPPSPCLQATNPEHEEGLILLSVLNFITPTLMRPNMHDAIANSDIPLGLLAFADHGPIHSFLRRCCRRCCSHSSFFFSLPSFSSSLFCSRRFSSLLFSSLLFSSSLSPDWYPGDRTMSTLAQIIKYLSKHEGIKQKFLMTTGYCHLSEYAAGTKHFNFPLQRKFVSSSSFVCCCSLLLLSVCVSCLLIPFLSSVWQSSYPTELRAASSAAIFHFGFAQVRPECETRAGGRHDSQPHTAAAADRREEDQERESEKTKG